MGKIWLSSLPFLSVVSQLPSSGCSYATVHAGNDVCPRILSSPETVDFRRKKVMVRGAAGEKEQGRRRPRMSSRWGQLVLIMMIRRVCTQIIPAEACTQIIPNAATRTLETIEMKLSGWIQVDRREMKISLNIVIKQV